MTSFERFNNLNGVRSDRNELLSIIEQAKTENNTSVIYRLESILQANPDAKTFLLEIEQFPSTGLSAPRHTGSYKEALDECGRLRKGFKFEKGSVVKVESKKKDNAQKTKKSTDKVAKVVAKTKKTIKPTSVKKEDFNIVEKAIVEKMIKDQKITRSGKASNYGTKRKKATPKPQETRTFEKKSFAPEEWQKADTRKTTSLIKKYLKEKFGIDCRVKSEYYSGGSSLNIWYDFGPSEKEVEADIKRLQYGSFDGMTDMYNYGDEAENGIILDGYRLNEYKYVFVSREIPKSFYVTLAKLVSQKDKFNDVPEFNGNESTLYDNFPKMFGEYWSWGQLIRSKFWRANFVTQKEEEIQNIEIQGDYNEYYLTYTYTVNGKKYDSRKPTIYPTKMVKEKNIIKNLIKFIDYGKDEVAVIGYTGEINEDLKEAGGKASSEIKFQGENHKGYIFHKSKANTVANILINYAQEDKSTGLSAPFHVGIARTALDSCSRLKKGFKYLPGGNIEKVAAKKKTAPTKRTKPTKKVKKDAKESNPVPFSKKPKSSSIQTAIKDILGLSKYKGISEMVASILFKYYKEEPHLLEPKELYLTEFEKGVLSKDSKLHSYIEYQHWHQELELSSLGEDFILAVRGRLESLRNQKHNYAMFDGLANPGPEIIVMDSEQKPTPVLPIVPIQPIHENKVENWVDKQEPAQEEKPKNLSSGAKRLLATNFDTLAINEEWSELMQNPAANLKIAIWGKPKNGKTSASLQMAEYFTNFGKVLYNFADQGFNLSTQELWKDSGLANNGNAEPSDISTTQELETEIATGQYKFVFIDMISDYIRKEKLKPEEFKERFIKRFPNVSFILIFEVTKSGDFKGDQGWTHVVDAIMTVEDFFMENRGRYGMGERIIWEEGFQRFNPKRYEEYIREKRELEADNAPVETVIN